jgi:hypothetical protein
LARRLLDRGPGSGTLAVLVGVLAATGPTAHSSLGTTMGDTTVSIPFLVALLVVLGDRGIPDQRAGTTAFLGAGILAGASFGSAHQGLASSSGAPVPMVLGRQVRVGCRASSAPSSACGFGAWCWRLWERFGNPFFRTSTRSSGHPTCPPRPFGTHVLWPGVPLTC